MMLFARYLFYGMIIPVILIRLDAQNAGKMNKASRILVGGALGQSILIAASAADSKSKSVVQYRQSVMTVNQRNFASTPEQW